MPATAAWLTDLHLNFVTDREVSDLAQRVRAADPDVVLVGGDTAEAHTIVPVLDDLSTRFGRPVYVVLGNHDYYQGSIADVRAAVADLCRRRTDLHWLPEAGVVELTPSTALVGHGGWADGRLGRYDISPALLNDYLLIHELAGLTDAERLSRLHALADDAAACFRHWLPQALARYPHVLLLTHVPPFRDAAWYAGKPSDDEHLPHFSSKASGDAILDATASHPQSELTVLCGHTHGGGEVSIQPDLHVITGPARYGAPTIQRLLNIP